MTNDDLFEKERLEQKKKREMKQLTGSVISPVTSSELCRYVKTYMSNV